MQRGDAEMAQKLWRVVRACVEMGGRNPIQQIHDQGAGGNCNVVRLLSLPCSLSAALRSAACNKTENGCCQVPRRLSEELQA